MAKRKKKNWTFKNNATNSSSTVNLLDTPRFKEKRELTIQELEAKIKTLQGLVGKYDPRELLSRAAYELLPLWLGKQDIKDSHLLHPSLEYLQFLIARSPSQNEENLTEETWDTIWELVLAAMHLMQIYYFTQGRDYSQGRELPGLQFMFQLKTLYERVDNYTFFLEEFWRTHLMPLEVQIVELFGINLEQLIQGLLKIKNHHQTGLTQRYIKFGEMEEEFSSLLATKIEDSKSIPTGEGADYADWVLSFIDNDPELKSKRDEIDKQIQVTFTPEVFNITEISGLPSKLLSLLSVRPAEAILTDLFNNKDDLSPASPSPLHQKPFVEVQGKYYSFFHSGFEDRIPRLIEAEILKLKPELVNSIQKKRSDVIEQQSINLLAKVIKPDVIHRNPYYPTAEGLTELDGLLLVDDILFIVEAKSGTHKNSDSALDLINDYGRSIIAGHRQSLRALNYIQSADKVDFFDRTGKKVIFSIKRADLRSIHRIVVTKENLGWVGARVGVLHEVEPSIKGNAPWHISIEDLRVIAELFKGNELQFMHYAEVRREVSHNLSIVQHDELQHIGLYLRMNLYHKNEQFVNEEVSFVTFDDSFMKEIDQYFYSKAQGENVEVPEQNIEPVLKNFLENLRDSKIPGRFEVASFILSMGSEQRKKIADSLNHLKEGITLGRIRSVKTSSTEFAKGITITTATNELYANEEFTSAAQAKLCNSSRWLIVQLNNDMSVKSIKCISPDEYTEGQIGSGIEAIDRKVKATLQRNKVGRNEPCPCGSGKKYKKCHWLKL